MAEILGGLGLMIGALPVDQIRSLGLSQLAAFGLFFLTIAVTPANVYMATHNAPGPLPKDAPTTVIPPAGHAARWAMQARFSLAFSENDKLDIRSCFCRYIT